jgi:hypothetical protein
MWCG